LKDCDLSQQTLTGLFFWWGIDQNSFSSKALQQFWQRKIADRSVNPDRSNRAGSRDPKGRSAGWWEWRNVLLLDVTPLSLGMKP